jgi:hypothetical protein
MALEMKIEANWIRSFVYEVCSLMRLCIMERYHIKVTTHLAKPHVCGDAYVHPVFGQGLQDVQCPVSYMDNPIEPCILTVTL